MIRSLLFYLFATIFIATTVSADIYKCVSDDGVVKFSDQPCGDNAEITFHFLSIDDLISLASPYEQPIKDPNRISNDLLIHSRKLGDRILPGKPFYGHHVQAKNDHHSQWEIHLRYAPKSLTDWQIIMDYEKKPTHDGYSLWLKSIVIKRWGKPYSPSTMKYIEKIRKIGPGAWVTRQ
jgi:hypothetical protein